MNTRIAIAVAALTLPSFCLLAKGPEKKAKSKDVGNRVEFVKTSEDTTVYKILESDRSKDINEIAVPHFAIHTLNNKFVMTIGAKINPIIGTDLGSNLYKQADAGINFIPGQIAIPATSGHKSDFYINALNADVDLQIVGFGGTKDQITGYIKLGTNGTDNHIHLKKAYMKWRGLSAGLKHSLFQDEAVIPPTIDPQGPNGIVSHTVTEIGYESPSFSGFNFGIGLDMPTYSTSNGVYRGKDYYTENGLNLRDVKVCDPDAYDFQVPDIPMYVAWGHSDLNRIKLAAIIRPMIYKDLLNDKRRSSVGWGLSLSGNINPVEPLVFYLQATYGKGIGAYIQDLAGQPFSFVPNNEAVGHMTPSPMLGWSAGVTYNINPKWQVNAMASQARVWDVAPYAEAQAETGAINNYKYGTYVAANVFYNISSYFQVGAEYLYGYRQSWNVGSGHDNRIQLQFQFSL